MASTAPHDHLIAELARIDGASVALDVPLSELSHWRIGGSASVVIAPSTVKALQRVRSVLADSPTVSLVIGQTSNLLFDSAGFEGVLIQVTDRLAGIEVNSHEVEALAGTSMRLVARATADSGLAGLEHTVGIPGTLGGLVMMNGGSQRRYIGEHVIEVSGVDARGELVVFKARDLDLGYRSSGLEGHGLALTTVRLRLPDREEPHSIHSRMDAIVAERAAKFPLGLPSCGSTFLSDPAMYATVGPPGKAIEEAGLKGLQRGGAQISPRHANFIVNTGGAVSDDVLWLIRSAQTVVKDRTGYLMRCEARYVSTTGEVLAADVAALRRFPTWPTDD